MTKKGLTSKNESEASTKALGNDARDMMEDAAVGYYGNFGQADLPSLAEQALRVTEPAKQNKS